MYDGMFLRSSYCKFCRFIAYKGGQEFKDFMMLIDTRKTWGETADGVEFSKTSNDTTNFPNHPTNHKNHKKYHVSAKMELNVMEDHRRMAISLSDYLWFRDKSENTSSMWLNITFPISISLFFSLLCLIGTVPFYENNKILWFSVLTVVTHGAGSIMFALLSICLWQMKRRFGENPGYKQTKEKLDYLFGIDSK